jgi:hypothetical protein
MWPQNSAGDKGTILRAEFYFFPNMKNSNFENKVSMTTISKKVLWHFFGANFKFGISDGYFNPVFLQNQSHKPAISKLKNGHFVALELLFFGNRRSWIHYYKFEIFVARIFFWKRGKP